MNRCWKYYAINAGGFVVILACAVLSSGLLNYALGFTAGVVAMAVPIDSRPTRYYLLPGGKSYARISHTTAATERAASDLGWTLVSRREWSNR